MSKVERAKIAINNKLVKQEELIEEILEVLKEVNNNPDSHARLCPFKETGYDVEKECMCIQGVGIKILIKKVEEGN